MLESGDGVLRPGQVIKPQVDEKTAAELVQRLYGLEVKRIAELNAYDDQNFLIICEEDHYVLKITNSLDSARTSFIEGQTDLLILLNERNVKCPGPVRNLENRYYTLESFDGGSGKHVVRLLTYIPGKLLHHVQLSDALLVDVGQFAARLDGTLKDFRHPAYEADQSSLWMLKSVPRLKDFVYVVENEERRLVVNEVIAEFENEVLRNIDNLETGVIHGDLNEQNILVDGENEDEVLAVLDFGDSQNSCLVFELAIALCYMLIQAKDIARGIHVIRGYQKLRKLPQTERKILKICICARLCQSLVLGAYSHLNDPRNEYLLSTQKPGWTLFDELWPLANEELLRIWHLTEF